jgi:hypothetical protein
MYTLAFLILSPTGSEQLLFHFPSYSGWYRQFSPSALHVSNFCDVLGKVQALVETRELCRPRSAKAL